MYLLGNRLKHGHTMGNRLQQGLSTIGTYLTPENIRTAVELGIAGHKAYSDIERYRNQKHD